MCHTTQSSLFTTDCEKAEFTIKKAMLMEIYKHAVQPAIHSELTKMFIACKALHFDSQFKCNPRNFRIVCPSDPTVFVIINTHVDDGGVIHTSPAKYAETFEILSKRYPRILDESKMDRYLGMGFSINEDTVRCTCCWEDPRLLLSRPHTLWTSSTLLPIEPQSTPSPTSRLPEDSFCS